MTAYYNEIDPYAAQWLRNLIAAGAIAPGDVDERDIRLVQPEDLIGYEQCHFFAGLGGWSYALRLAGWPDDRPVWTGSCPCQPFSAAGKRAGTDDARHLWPDWYRLIVRCREAFGAPAVILGEQVASKDALGKWFDPVQTDLERAGYAVGAADLCAAGVEAPHIRQRLWFVADANGGIPGDRNVHRSRQYRFVEENGGAHIRLAHAERDAAFSGRSAVQPREGAGATCAGAPAESGRRGVLGLMGNAHDQGPQGRGRTELPECAGERVARAAGDVGGVADADSERRIEQRLLLRPEESGRVESEVPKAAGRGSFSFWSDADWLPCRDGKWRPVEPGTFPLAHGVPGRVGRLRAYGNAINPWVAAAFIDAYLGRLDLIDDWI